MNMENPFENRDTISTPKEGAGVLHGFRSDAGRLDREEFDRLEAEIPDIERRISEYNKESFLKKAMHGMEITHLEEEWNRKVHRRNVLRDKIKEMEAHTTLHTKNKEEDGGVH